MEGEPGLPSLPEPKVLSIGFQTLLCILVIPVTPLSDMNYIVTS